MQRLAQFAGRHAITTYRGKANVISSHLLAVDSDTKDESSNLASRLTYLFYNLKS